MSLVESVPFHISVRVGDDDAVVLDLDGEFDLSEVDAFRACVAGIVKSCNGAVIVDLAGVTFIDSSAISALLNARRSVLDEGREFRLDHLSPSVVRVFELAGLTGRFGAGG
jgi:anti-sigma B factor antagonist